MVTAFCLAQCNEGEGAAGTGGEIVINDSLPGGIFNSTVSDITVTASTRSLQVSWKAPDDASNLAHYLVEWQGNEADATLYSVATQGTSYTITRLYNDHYTVGVRAVSKYLQKSEITQAAGQYQPIIDEQGPGIVSNLSISPVATSTLISWENPIDEDFEYTIVNLKEGNAEEWTRTDTLSYLDSEWNITGLDQATTYDYSIQTFDYIGNGSDITSGSFRTLTEISLEKLNENNEPLWDIADFSSEETGGDRGQAANAIDGDNSTFWHSVWYSGNYGNNSNTGTLPQYIVVDLNQEVIPSVVSLYRRDGNSRGPTSVKLESTLEEPISQNIQWNDLGTYALDGGNNNGALSCYIRVLEKARYIKITVLAAANSGTYAMIREIDINALVDEE